MMVIEMATELIIDDRTDPSQSVRALSDRRVNKVCYHLLKRPFKDSHGLWVVVDRRSGVNRRKNTDGLSDSSTLFPR